MPNKLDENMCIKSPGLLRLERDSSPANGPGSPRLATGDSVVSMWRCWNCKATENEMDA